MTSTAYPILYMATGMFSLTFLAGYLPTKLASRKRAMTMMTLIGAGLLVGAALIVILPEGMSILYGSIKATETANRYAGASLVFGFLVMLLID